MSRKNIGILSLPLSTYVSLFKEAGILISAEVKEQSKVDYLSYDTRKIKENTLFFCKGVHFKPQYLSDAQALGASAYVSEVKYDVTIPCILVSDIRRAMSLAAFYRYEERFEGFYVTGITGTKGKSTVTYYIKSILDRYLENECGVLSSIDNYDGVIREESHLTTPEAIELCHHFENAVSSGLTHLVMEVSSQGLKYGRVEGVNFDVACFTNIGQDHISDVEHPDFDDYFESKLKIFDGCKAACINTDADSASRALEYAKGRGCKIVTFGSHPSDDVYIHDVKKEDDGIYFSVSTEDFSDRMRITMPGLFNVENAACAIAACLCLGVPAEYIKRGLDGARVKGRMEIFPSKDGRVIGFVDYAHNKMSFEALMRSVRSEYPEREVIMVFGSAGGKALSRRFDLGEAAGKFADYTIITEEDSGEEPFMNIANHIAGKIAEAGGRYSIVEDRDEAIREGVFEHGEDKVVLVLGKGRETRQKRGTLYIDTPSDVDYLLKWIGEYDRLHTAKTDKV